MKNIKKILSFAVVLIITCTLFAGQVSFTASASPAGLWTLSNEDDDDYDTGDAVQMQFSSATAGYRVKSETYTSGGETSTVNYTYNKNGLMTKKDYGNNLITEYSYDKRYNLIRETNKDDDNLYYSYTYSYDSDGNLIEETHESLNYGSAVIKYTYKTYKNASGENVIEKNVYENGEHSKTLTYVYDINGNKIKETDSNEYNTDYIIDYTYDDNGNKIKEVVTDYFDYETYTRIYDTKGNRIKAYDGKDDSNTYIYTYDRYNNVISRKYQGQEGYYEKKYDYTYDENGNITSCTCDTGSSTGYHYTVKNTYDENGNKIKATYENSLGIYAEFAFTYEKTGEIEESADENTFVHLTTSKFTCNGKEKKPKPIITTSQGERLALIENKDYTVTYTNNIEGGTATATVTFIGEYRKLNEVTFNFEIEPDPNSSESTSQSGDNSSDKATDKSTDKTQNKGEDKTKDKINFSHKNILILIFSASVAAASMLAVILVVVIRKK